MARWINWAPTAGEEVAQNVRQLVKTAPGTVPLSRAMGTPQDALDTPISAAGARLQADVIRAVRTYEPRVRVQRVRLAPSSDGRLQAVAEIVAP
jgi:phage baseplate assembly protein W